MPSPAPSTFLTRAFRSLLPPVSSPHVLSAPSLTFYTTHRLQPTLTHPQGRNYDPHVADSLGTSPPERLPRNLSRLHCSTTRLLLDFKSPTWQNRPARIYFQPEQSVVDARVWRTIPNLARHLVLAQPTGEHPTSVLTSPNTQTDALVFNYSGTTSREDQINIGHGHSARATSDRLLQHVLVPVVPSSLRKPH